MDGETDHVLDNRGHAEMNLSVSGPLRWGDAVFLDLDANGTLDPGEALWIDPSSGEALASFSLDALASGSKAIHYVPNGDDMMERGEFVISATVDYDESSHADPDALSWRTPLQHDGVSAFALIPPLTEESIGHFRVTCASGGPPCAVFLDCRGRGQDADYLAELDAIEDKETLRMSEDDLADILGVRDRTDRPSCRVLSNHPVEVQVLVRSGFPPIYF